MSCPFRKCLVSECVFLPVGAGHDTTVLPLLSAWGVWDGQWPSYASIITLELYETSDGHYFRLLYAGKELKLPTCSQGTNNHHSRTRTTSGPVSELVARYCTAPASILHQEGLRVTAHLMVLPVFDHRQPCVPCPS